MSDEQTNLVRVGQNVPNFELETFNPRTGDFGKVSLDEFKKARRWLVLAFYPADYTFICPTELADLAEQYDELRETGAEVISVSTDTKFTHLAWQREEKLLRNVTYQMGADPTGRVSKLFGVYDEETGLDLRGTFIISPDGKLTGAEVNFYNCGRNFTELVRKVKAFAYLSAHSEEVCPANWKEGQKTLKPGAKLVGRVGDNLNA